MLQVPTVFLSVSKAQTAPSAELTKAFGPDVRQDDIREEILRKGEVQVGERERKEISERVEREVLDIVSGRLVDPTTKRVYTPGMISKALDQLSSASGQQQQQQQQQGTDEDGTEDKQRKPKPLWSGVVPNKSAKSQALEAMKALIAWQPIPVMRARMRLRVSCPVTLLKQGVKASGQDAPSETPSSSAGGGSASGGGGGASGGGKGTKKKAKGTKKGKKGDVDDESDHEATPTGPAAAANNNTGAAPAASNVKDKILSYIESVETQEVLGDEWEVIGFADPGAFKLLNEFVGNDTKGRGRVEVLDMTVTKDE